MADQISLAGLAELLAAFRRPGRAVPTAAAEAFVQISMGADTVDALQRACGLDRATASRVTSFLRGRARFDRGKIVNGMEPPLVVTRRHPHGRGMQLLVSREGRRLLAKIGAASSSAARQGSEL